MKIFRVLNKQTSESFLLTGPTLTFEVLVSRLRVKIGDVIEVKPNEEANARPVGLYRIGVDDIGGMVLEALL